MEAWLADADACCCVVEQEHRQPRVSCPAAFLSPPPPPPRDEVEGRRAGDEAPPSPVPSLSSPLPPATPLSSPVRRRRESYHGDGPLSCSTGRALAAAALARGEAN